MRVVADSANVADALCVDVSAAIYTAKSMPKGDYEAYAECKRMLGELSLSRAEYEWAVKRIAEILEI